MNWLTCCRKEWLADVSNNWTGAARCRRRSRQEGRALGNDWHFDDREVKMYRRARRGAVARGLTVVVLLAASLAACTFDGVPGNASAPCGLLTERDASSFLGDQASRVDLSSWGETEVPEEDAAMVAAADAKMCVYVVGEVRSDPSVAIQLDRGLFRSRDDFLQAFDGGEALADGPGVAAVRLPREAGVDPDYESVVVLLNGAGDSFIVTSNIDKDLVPLADRIAERFGQ